MRTYVRPDIVLDQSFPIPPGAQGVVNDDQIVEYVPQSEEQPDDLAIPQNAEVVGYVRRFAPDGSLLIDVILEVDDNDHIVKYEVRKSKL